MDSYSGRLMFTKSSCKVKKVKLLYILASCDMWASVLRPFHTFHTARPQTAVDSFGCADLNAASFIVKTMQPGDTGYTVYRLQQNKQKITKEV